MRDPNQPLNTSISAMKFIAFVCVCGLAASVIGVLVQSSSSGGIVPAPSGEAVYLTGEACTINMTLDRSLEDLQADWEFCFDRHTLILERGNDETQH